MAKDGFKQRILSTYDVESILGVRRSKLHFSQVEKEKFTPSLHRAAPCPPYPKDRVGRPYNIGPQTLSLSEDLTKYMRG